MTNKNDSFATEFMGGCLAAIILVFLGPLLYFAGGYLTGLILKWIIGSTVVNGLNILFNTTRFTVDSIPIVCGALGVVGSFFKNTNTSNSK